MVHIELELAVVALERLHSISVYPSAILTKGAKRECSVLLYFGLRRHYSQAVTLTTPPFMVICLSTDAKTRWVRAAFWLATTE